MSCPSCCDSCQRSNHPANNHYNIKDPFSVENLLSSGTIRLTLAQEAPFHDLCDHSHSEDGWHFFRGHLVALHLLNPLENIFVRELDFLAKQRFISATYRVYSHTTVFVRIYLIPHDLRNVNGSLNLLVRKPEILRQANSCLRRLLPRIVQDVGNWEGVDSASSSTLRPFIPSDNDRRTIAEIYGDLPSPNIATTHVAPIIDRLLDFEDTLEDLGMRSVLYKYQRRSVAAMVQRELDLNSIPNPLFIPLVGMSGEEFYFQPGSMELLMERPMVTPTRGGVLCEELGTGKTVMILGLILATVDQLPSSEESIMDPRPILTPLAFRHFPGDYAESRYQLSRGKRHYTPCGIPSLVELLLHRIRTSPHDLQSYEQELDATKLSPLLSANVPFYHHYHDETADNQRNRRGGTHSGPRVVFLSTASIIVVPANLVSQWDREIQKHCRYPLRVLLLRSSTAMPPVRSLASDYDIILMTYQRFTAEGQKQNVSELHCWTVCNCPEFDLVGPRVPNCQCKDNYRVSALLQVRWKRLVIDEGHVSASANTSLNSFARALSVERRWIVTGTPTSNLLGLSLGKTTRAPEDHDVDWETTPQDGLSEDGPSISQLPSLSNDLNDRFLPPPRVWTKYDHQDVIKLGIMMTDFLVVPQFKDPLVFKNGVSSTPSDSHGPRLGGLQVLNQVMEMVMIRHRIEDVEKDVVIPPMSHEIILLDMDPFAVKSYNAMQATIAINAVDSQRTDQDYMFHPNNATLLQRAVENMSQLMFWAVDQNLYNVDELTKNAEDQMQRAIERNSSPEDIFLLREALAHIRSAAEDSAWRALQIQEEVPYRIYGRMNLEVFNAWTRTPTSAEPTNFDLIGFMHPDRLIRLRNVVVVQPLMSEEKLIQTGMAISETDRQSRRLYEESDKQKTKRTKFDIREIGPKVAHAPAKAVAGREKLEEIRRELRAALARLDSLQQEEDGTSVLLPAHTSVLTPTLPNLSMLALSPLAQLRIGSSGSSKVDYIINEVLTYASEEKFLIFSKSPLSLAHVADALDLIQVKYLQFTTDILPQVREQVVMTFETSETYRVFLMELKHGARGLNLISASRVIFCEPVWQADVESQAIKRVHRIGQTRTIKVKTLAIRDTAEENMGARRNALKDSRDKLPSLTEESGMRHYIENPKFISSPPIPSSTIDVPFLNLSRDEENTHQDMDGMVVFQDLASSPGPSTGKSIRAVDPLDEDSHRDEPPRKKKKGVTFAV